MVDPWIDSLNRGVPTYSIDQIRPRLYEIALLIPVINEGERIQAELLKISAAKFEVDVIISDGGSIDGSLNLKFLREVGVTALLTKQSQGFLSTQLRAGFHYCLSRGYNGVITIDGNNKDDIEGIPAFIEKLVEGYDYVQGSRFVGGGVSENTPLVRDLGIRLIHSPLTSIGARFKITDSTNGFRAHSRKLLADKRVNIFRDVFESYELLAYLPVRAGRLGFRMTEVPVGRRYPSNAVTPTKIVGLSSYIKLLIILGKAVTQRYNP